MDEYTKALSFYRLEKAKEDLKSAKVNYENGLYKASVNRSYYAIFHAIRAVNAINKFDSKRHSGVISYFNQHFIHTDKFNGELYKIVASAFKLRERCDYDDFYVVSRDQAENQLKNAEFFIKEVERFIYEHFKEK